MVDTSLYMSDEARQHYGPFTEQFKGWLGEQGIRHAIVVSSSDFVDHPDQAKAVKSTTRMAEFKNFVGQFDEFPQGVIDKDIGGMSRQAYLNKPVAYGYDSDGDGVRDTVVIVTPHRDATKLEIVSGIAGFPQSGLENLTGTDLEWQVFITAHEIGHAGQNNGNKTSLTFETGADENARLFWNRADAAGLVTSGTVPAEFISMRSLAAFSPDKTNNAGTHFTSAAIRLEGEAVAPELHDKKFMNARAEVSQMVAREVGDSLVTDQDRINVLKHVVNQSGIIGMRMESAGFSLSPQQKDLLTDIVDGKVPIQEGLGQLDADALSKIQGYMSFPEVAAGLREIKTHPELMHETVRKMYLEGRFDDNPIGKQYAHEFLTTARQHGTTYFGVHDHTTKYVAPVFDVQERGITPPVQDHGFSPH